MTEYIRKAWTLSGLILLCLITSLPAFAQDAENWEEGLAVQSLSAGRRMADEGRYDEAIRRYNRALDTNKLDVLNQSIAYNNRGNARAELGEHNLALGDYNRALKLRPGFVEAIYNRGITYHQLGLYQKSVDDFGLVVKINIGFASAYFNRSFPLAKLGRFKEAIADVQHAISLSPTLTRYKIRLRDLQALARKAKPAMGGAASGKTPPKAAPESKSTGDIKPLSLEPSPEPKKQ